MKNNDAGTPPAPSREQLSGIITTTPSKPGVRNPYRRTFDPSNDNNRAPAGSGLLTPSTTPVRNPYVKSTSHIRNEPTTYTELGASAKRHLDYSNEGGPDDIKPTKKMSPLRPAKNKFLLSGTVNVTVDGSNAPIIDKSKMYTLYFDGGSRGNPGIAGAGMVIYDDRSIEIWSGKHYIGEKETNNVAEYRAFITGMECAARLGIERIQARGDSLLVVKQMKGEWDCKKPHLRLLLQEALQARSKFTELNIAHVKRDENRRADELANAAMDERVTDLGVATSSLKTPELSQESSEMVESGDIIQHLSIIKPCSTFDDPELEEQLVLMNIPCSAQKETPCLSQESSEVPKPCSTFDDPELEEQLVLMNIPHSAQKEMTCLSQESSQVTRAGTFDDQELEEALGLITIPSPNQKAYITAEEQSWLSELPFLAQFEIQRFNLQNNQRLQHTISSTNNMNEVISAIYKEVKPSTLENTSSKQAPPYEHFLKHCLESGFEVDKGVSCLFVFHAKLSANGIELLAPEPADVETRRIHRCYGSHRFLDLRLDEKCNLKTLKQHYIKCFFTADNKLLIAGRQYSILYSNTSEIPVILRLFAESGIGINKCISASEVAACCIPKPINPDLSLTKYMKRMQLSFTPSVPSLRLDQHQLEAITDIHGKDGCIMTDGCGLISRMALNKVYNEYTRNIEERCKLLGKSFTPKTMASCPYSSFQARIGGIKGMFVVDDSLEGVKIQYRPSQLKYHTPLTFQDNNIHQLNNNYEMYNTVDVMGWDRAKPTHAYLSTGFIALLEQRGVPNDFFTKLAQKEIDELLSISKDYRRLFDRYSARAFLRDSSCIFDDDILLRMLQANVPLNEPMMLHKVNKFIKDELRLFKEKSKFPVSESRYLRMLPDHTGLLKSDEAYIAIGNESCHYDVGRLGKIIAIRNPSYFPQDIRKLKIVSTSDLVRRCPTKGKFFSGILAGIVLSTKGDKSEAEMMSGGDFDGDIAWCCWNEILVESVQECEEYELSSNTGNDPWKQRLIDYQSPSWTNLIIDYTMHHRHDKQTLGKIATTLEMMRDSPRFTSHEVNAIAKKAFIQVDNPYRSQWTETDDCKYRISCKPHWHRLAQRNSYTYRSNKVLGQIFDMLEDVGRKGFDYNDVELQMNIHIIQTIEKAENRNRDRVELIRKDMLQRLRTFNNRYSSMGTKQDSDEEFQKRLTRKATKDFFKQYRSEIENIYKDDDMKEVISILYEQTYFHQREKMMRGKGPYVFAWEVGHDHLCRIFADRGGVGVTVARGNDCMIFRG